MKKTSNFLIAEKGYSKASRKYSKNFQPDKRKQDSIISVKRDSH